MTEFADQTWKSGGRASNQPKFLDRATFLARQASDRFSIMNLLDPSAFHDTDKGEKPSGNQGGLSFRENSEMKGTLGNLGQSSTLDERLDSTLQDSFHESAAEFPSFFQTSEVQTFDTDLVDEVTTSLSNLMKVADYDVAVPSDSVLIREERGKRVKKGKKEKKEKKGKKDKKKEKKGKKDKKDKKVKKDKEKGSESKHSSDVSCDESHLESVDHLMTRTNQTIHDDDKTTTSLQIEDLRQSRRKERRPSKQVGSTKSAKAFSQSMPNVQQIHGFIDHNQGSRSRRKASDGSNSPGTKPSSTKSVDGIIAKQWTPTIEGQHSNFSALPFVKVKTTKLDASEFEESCAESCWSDDDDDDDSAWDSEATDLFAKRSRAGIFNAGGLTSNASCASYQSDSYAEPTGMNRRVPFMQNGALDDRSIQTSASTGRIQESAPSKMLNPGARIPGSHVALCSQNSQALSLPSTLGPRANSSNSLESSTSAGTGMSTSIADRSITSRDKSRSSKSKKESKYHATLGRVEARGNGLPLQAGIEGRSTHSSQSSLSSAPAHLASQKGEGRLKYAPSGSLRPEGSIRSIHEFALDSKGSDVVPISTLSQVAPAVPASPVRPRMLGIGLVGLAKARFGKSKIDKFRGSSPR
ncbi:hypothetical protein MHU86_15647 [Fragilaria crotonensis]|nr:hypothetical protein MHU86_15647 [Fragilaria crotonensis]